MSEKLGKTITFAKEPLKILREQIEGETLVPGDADYNRASKVWDSFGFAQHPAIVILPENAADVQTAVAFARQHNLPIAVQSGGHGHPHPANDAMFINFEKMTGLEVDPATATVRVEPGVLFSDLVKEASKHGLAPLNGFAPTVGVTGFMLGGGIGWLTRQYGSGAGSIRSVELVTASGDLLQVNAVSSPELFWGLRGAGANFGVVTALEFELYPVAEIFGGQVVFPLDKAKEIVAAYFKFTETVPKELTSALRIMHFPAADAIPPPLRGIGAVVIMACYSGDPDQAESVLAPLRSLDKPLLDTFGKMAYSDVAKISNDPSVASPTYSYSDGGGVKSFTPDGLDNFVNITGNPDGGIMMAEIRHLGGVLATQDENKMSFDFRDPPYYLYIQATAPKSEQLEKARQSSQKLMGKLKPSMPGRLLLNFIDAFGEVGLDQTKAAYPPASFQRLRDLKDNYDPENVFRFNHNIPPTGQTGVRQK